MHTFEIFLGLLLGATILSALARRVNIPYPTLLAVGGAIVAFLPGTPHIVLPPPELILALFVAPVLVDAAYDTSLRDLRDNWRPVLSLVLVAVGLTTIVVAFAARQFLPDLPWAAAIALGALLAPPDAVAALAVLQQVNPPHRIRKVLEGESLLNDASALLIYKIAVGSIGAAGFQMGKAFPTFLLVVFGSAATGWILAKLVGLIRGRVSDMPTSVIFQFVMSFGVWLIAEQLGLSGVVTIVVFGIMTGQETALDMSARMRVSTFAVWESATFVLNVLAFTLIGLEMRPILDKLSGTERFHYFAAALALLAVVIVVRLFWVMSYTIFHKKMNPSAPDGGQAPRSPLSTRGGVVVGWCGMRGIVTLAAAIALPEGFPYSNFIQLSAFVVVLGTLVIQGLTLRPLLLSLRLPPDDTVESEINIARSKALKAAIMELDGDTTPVAQRLKTEYQEALRQTRRGEDIHETENNALRRRVLTKSRQTLNELRSNGTIGDDAYRFVEEELDWIELSATGDTIP
ncbi:sodium:proton antiporter [bacterium]|nr:MAG: sodium:proton antiporter [bacterium]